MKKTTAKNKPAAAAAVPPPQAAKSALELKAHLEQLGIACALLPDGMLAVHDAQALLRHLTDEEFIGRGVTTERAPGPPVPVHRVDNPIGALQEWCQQRGPNAKPPRYVQSENVGTIHAPRFRCEVFCDGEMKIAEESNKSSAKRKAAQDMLEALASKYGPERPAP